MPPPVPALAPPVAVAPAVDVEPPSELLPPSEVLPPTDEAPAVFVLEPPVPEIVLVVPAVLETEPD